MPVMDEVLKQTASMFMSVTHHSVGIEALKSASNNSNFRNI